MSIIVDIQDYTPRENQCFKTGLGAVSLILNDSVLSAGSCKMVVTCLPITRLKKPFHHSVRPVNTQIGLLYEQFSGFMPQITAGIFKQ